MANTISQEVSICKVLHDGGMVSDEILSECLVEIDYRSVDDDKRLLNALIHTKHITCEDAMLAMKLRNSLESLNDIDALKAEQKLMRMRMTALMRRALRVLKKSNGLSLKMSKLEPDSA